MDFGSHQKLLINDIGKALTKDKTELLARFLVALKQAESLYQTRDYEFWINTIGEIPASEIPLTNCGHRNACTIHEKLHGLNRNLVQSSIVSISESLITYSNENEICAAQSDYHFYYDIKGKSIFKESELGFFDGIEPKGVIHRRIAKVSELSIKDGELYA